MWIPVNYDLKSGVQATDGAPAAIARLAVPIEIPKPSQLTETEQEQYILSQSAALSLGFAVGDIAGKARRVVVVAGMARYREVPDGSGTLKASIWRRPSHGGECRRRESRRECLATRARRQSPARAGPDTDELVDPGLCRSIEAATVRNPRCRQLWRLHEGRVDAPGSVDEVPRRGGTGAPRPVGTGSNAEQYRCGCRRC